MFPITGFIRTDSVLASNDSPLVLSWLCQTEIEVFSDSEEELQLEKSKIPRIAGNHGIIN